MFARHIPRSLLRPFTILGLAMAAVKSKNTMSAQNSTLTGKTSDLPQPSSSGILRLQGIRSNSPQDCAVSESEVEILGQNWRSATLIPLVSRLDGHKMGVGKVPTG